MKRMTPEAFDRARTYLMEQARPLEREVFRFQFEDAGPEGALEALAAYRNPDGGFGRALEPDYRAEASSVLATCIALGRLEELGVAPGHPYVAGAEDYLLRAYDSAGRRWVIVPDTQEPHAPWWNAGDLEATFSGFRINPLAEVLARLACLERSRERVASLLPELLQRLATVADPAPSEIECLTALWRAGVERAFLGPWLAHRIPEAVEQDSGRWGSYCLKPLWAVPAPDAPGADALRSVLDEALDYEIRTQAADGAWEPYWDWGNAFPGDWTAARREWRGWLALRNLNALRAFDRLPQA
jgi:hypothetical protein